MSRFHFNTSKNSNRNQNDEPERSARGQTIGSANLVRQYLVLLLFADYETV